MRELYQKSALIGLAFFAACVLWTVYNTYVPLLLNTYLTSTFLIGLVTACANTLGAVLHPLVGSLSDKTNSPYGRRLPYLLVGIPLSAGSLLLIAEAPTLIRLLLWLAVFNAVMSLWRTPAFALIADLTPSPFRSQANGVVNFLGGLGALLAFGAGALMFELGGIKPVFRTAALIALLVLPVLKLFLREPAVPAAAKQDQAAEEKGRETGLKAALEKTDAASPTLRALLVALMFYSLGICALETFFSLYVTTTLTDAGGNLLSGGDASLLMGVFFLAYMLFSVPAGLIAGRLGRKKTILLGLAGLSLLFFLLYIMNFSYLPLFLLVAVGICAAAAGINFLPAVTEQAGPFSFGKYTGYYHLVTFGSTVLSPLLFGLVRDWAGTYRSLLLYSALAFFAAVLPLLLPVPRGRRGADVQA